MNRALELSPDGHYFPFLVTSMLVGLLDDPTLQSVFTLLTLVTFSLLELCLQGILTRGGVVHMASNLP